MEKNLEKNTHMHICVDRKARGLLLVSLTDVHIFQGSSKHIYRCVKAQFPQV